MNRARGRWALAASCLVVLSAASAVAQNYNEAGHAFLWARDTAVGFSPKQSMSIIEESGGTETSRTNYFEVFPVSFQHVTGFSQAEKGKMRLVVTYGYSEPG